MKKVVMRILLLGVCVHGISLTNVTAMPLGEINGGNSPFDNVIPVASFESGVGIFDPQSLLTPNADPTSDSPFLSENMAMFEPVDFQPETETIPKSEPSANPFNLGMLPLQDPPGLPGDLLPGSEPEGDMPALLPASPCGDLSCLLSDFGFDTTPTEMDSDVTSEVPEPMSILLLAASLLGGAVVRKS